MDQSEKVKHVRDIPAESEDFDTRKPFKVQQENQRRFVRLEISAPMSMRRVKNNEGGFWPDGEEARIGGVILNISAGGLLVDLDQAIEADDIVSMHFTIQDVEVVDNVLGRVKRADIDSNGCIAGIEFVSVAYLMDHFSQAEMEIITEGHRHFDDSIREVLDRYVKSEHLTQEVG